MECKATQYDKCENGHTRSWTCSRGRPKECRICRRAAEDAQKQREKELRLQERRDLEAEEHARRLAALESDLAAKRQEALDKQTSQERAQVIRQREKDLQVAASLAIRAKPSPPLTVPPRKDAVQDSPTRPKGDKEKLSTPVPHAQNAEPSSEVEPRIDHVEFKSEARDDWQHQKQVEKVDNEAIDELMDLVGLEEVKLQILRIKAKIDTSKRQHTDVKKERFNAAFLGNPGTGK